MPARNHLQAAFLIVRRKVAASRTLPALFAGFGLFLGFLWAKDSFSLALRAYLFLFPYLFLFLSQDIFRDEIDSGALESVIFVNGGFREYLFSKLMILPVFGLVASAAMFSVFAACGVASGSARIVPGHLVQLLAGVSAGLYYLAVGGCLSFFFKAGSNVLIVIIGQVFMGIGFFLSMTSRRGWVEAVLSNDLSGPVRKLRFLGLTLLFPNAAIARPRPFLIAGLALAALGAICLARRRIRKLEIFQT